MKRTLSIFFRDIGRVRWLLLAFLLLLVGEVGTYASPQRRGPSAEAWWDIFLALWALTTWVVQFVLVIQLIHSDAPARIGAQWRSRPFRPGQLTMAKACGISVCVFFPPWAASQVARLLLGLRPGIGDAEGPLYHLAALSAFALIAVVASSTGRAFLTAIGLLVAFGFSFSLVASMLQGEWTWWNALWQALRPPIWPTSEVLLSLVLCGLALGSLASGYRKRLLPRAFLATGWACCLLFGISGGPSTREAPTYPDASERFRFVAAWTTHFSEKKPGWYGRLYHVRTEPRRVVVQDSFGWDEWPSPLTAVEPARIDGLGDVEFVSESVFQGFTTPTIGPLDPARFPTGRAGEIGIFGYTIRTYELLVRADPREKPRQSDWSWTMQKAPELQVEVRTPEPNIRVVSFDPAARRVSWPAWNLSTNLTMMWPISAGVRVLSIEVPRGSEVLLLRETVVGKGLVGFEDLPLEVPPDWRSQQEKGTNTSGSR